MLRPGVATIRPQTHPVLLARLNRFRCLAGPQAETGTPEMGALGAPDEAVVRFAALATEDGTPTDAEVLDTDLVGVQTGMLAPDVSALGLMGA